MLRQLPLLAKLMPPLLHSQPRNYCFRFIFFLFWIKATIQKKWPNGITNKWCEKPPISVVVSLIKDMPTFPSELNLLSFHSDLDWLLTNDFLTCLNTTTALFFPAYKQDVIYEPSVLFLLSWILTTWKHQNLILMQCVCSRTINFVSLKSITLLHKPF